MAALRPNRLSKIVDPHTNSTHILMTSLYRSKPSHILLVSKIDTHTYKYTQTIVEAAKSNQDEHP